VEESTTRTTARRLGCIGWGSLIENSGCLVTAGQWKNDGPLLPVEFARESSDGRITLVICPTAARVPTRWILVNQSDVQAARANLGFREHPKATQKWIDESIGFWERTSAAQYGMESETISAWGTAQGLDGVVWTNLPCGFKTSRHVMPSCEDLLTHLGNLDGAALGRARDYVRNAPVEVNTAYRRQIVAQLGWE